MLNGFLSQNRLLMAHTEGITGVQLRHFSPTCAVHIKIWRAGGCLVVAAQ